MKKVQIDIRDLLVVLEAMQEDGAEQIIFMEYNNCPAIADAASPENIISFQNYDDEMTDEDQVH